MKLEAADRWLKGRLQMPTVLRSDGLARLAPAIRAHAFFSAGVAQGHVLAKLREVSDAFTRGEMDLATARKKLKDWLGKKEEPGSKEDRQMGRLWSTARLNLILRQNARMAHAVGEWEQGQSDISRKLFPYWRYVASVSESPRGSHRAYAGKVWRKEDPIWHRIFPPWDFNCKCSVEEVAADEVEPDEVEPTTTDGRMPEVAESGFAFDPAEALRVYDPELIQDETLRGNVEQRLEEMGCARREDGKLEMPMGVPQDEETKAEAPEKDDLKVVGNTIQVKEDSSAQLDKQTLERLEKRKEENLLTQKRINAINLKGFHRIEGEHSREQDAAAVNPHFSTGEWQYINNCQRCVVAYEARRRGWDVEAKGCPSSDDSILNGGWLSVFKDAKITLARSIDEIERYMGMVFGECSRALVQVYWNAGGSHLFFVERINGKTVFTDPQDPNADISDYFSLANMRYTSIYRVDNLEIDDTLFKECCKNKG